MRVVKRASLCDTLGAASFYPRLSLSWDLHDPTLGRSRAVAATITAPVKVLTRLVRPMEPKRLRDMRMAGSTVMAFLFSLASLPVQPRNPSRQHHRSPPGVSTIDPATLTSRIEELTRATNMQGLTVTVFNDARVVYLRAFGSANLPANRPLRTETEFYGASLSKAVFGVLVCWYEARGAGKLIFWMRRSRVAGEPLTRGHFEIEDRALLDGVS
jgi:hypothetical protein